MKVADPEVRDWVRAVLAVQTADAQEDDLSRCGEVQRQATLMAQQQNLLLTLRIAEDIDQDTFAAKSTELPDWLAGIRLQL